MPNVFRFRRTSVPPEPNRNSEAIYANAAGEMKQVAPDGSETDLGGGATSGAVRVLKYDFDFTQAVALAAGVTVWTPAVGDWLLNAWFESDDPWIPDGMQSAKADIGVVLGGSWGLIRGGSNGLFASIAGPVDLGDDDWINDNEFTAWGSGTVQVDLQQGSLISFTASATGACPVQVRWNTTDPLKLVVSDGGNPGGEVFDGSGGASTLYIVVVTPGDAS